MIGGVYYSLTLTVPSSGIDFGRQGWTRYRKIYFFSRPGLPDVLAVRHPHHSKGLIMSHEAVQVFYGGSETLEDIRIYVIIVPDFACVLLTGLLVSKCRKKIIT